MVPRDEQVRPVRSGAMPAPADGCCVRAETAADLAAALAVGGVVVLVPVRVAGEASGSWLESCGKTQLAVSVAESMWRSGKLELLVWADASSRASVLSCYMEAAAAVGRGDGEGDAGAGRFAAWLGRTSRPWLVVLDDVRDTADLAGLWPVGPAGRVLVTTSHPSALSGGQRALIHPVGVFGPDQAVSLLVNRLAAEPGKCLGAEDLVAELGYEPLAVDQAGAVIASSALSCRDYLERFVRKRAGMARRSPPAASVTWAMSAEHAERLLPGGAVRTVLALAAVLDGHGIPGEVFTSQAVCDHLAKAAGGLAGPEGAREALDAAERAGLLSVGPAGTATVGPAGTATVVRMSKAVQAAVRAAAPAGTLDPAALAAADALVQVWPADEQPAWLARSLRSCVATLRAVAGDVLWADGCHPALLRAGQSHDRVHLASVSVGYWRDLAGASDQALGQGHPDTLTARERLAAAYLAAGRLTEAVAGFQQVLAERVRLLGPGHPSAVAARLDVGQALVAAKRFGDAVTVLDRVVGDYERVQGADHPATLLARDRLAAACLAAGRPADAIRHYRRALADRERVQGAPHPDTIATRQRLAGAYLATRRYKDAISHYERALAGSEHVLGNDHPDTITARSNLASAYHAAGRMVPALSLSEQTRADATRVWGADHPGTLTTCANLALAYYQAGRRTDAIGLLRDTAARCERVLPADDPITQAVRDSLASIAG
jgi:tetratricopeptide (TPR) repeat protein